jgi:hypothetical protein
VQGGWKGAKRNHSKKGQRNLQEIPNSNKEQRIAEIKIAGRTGKKERGDVANRKEAYEDLPRIYVARNVSTAKRKWYKRKILLPHTFAATSSSFAFAIPRRRGKKKIDGQKCKKKKKRRHKEIKIANLFPISRTPPTRNLK